VAFDILLAFLKINAIFYRKRWLCTHFRGIHKLIKKDDIMGYLFLSADVDNEQTEKIDQYLLEKSIKKTVVVFSYCNGCCSI
jgi:hypothetical protein